MQFSFTNDIDGSMVKNMLGRHGVSKRLLTKIKFYGGKITVNGIEKNAIFRLAKGDVVQITVPDEPDNESVIPENVPLEILFEDEHYLVVNKPAGVPSITGSLHPTGSMANFVKGYIDQQKYDNRAVHIITRLDRDTSGIMFFAKHRYAHALMQAPKFRHSLQKRYFALVDAKKNLSALTENDLAHLSENFQGATILPDSGQIKLPIGRKEGSIVERQVRFDGLLEAKPAWSSYEKIARKNDLFLLDVILHTGKTHQIRVHFSHLGYPLIGDDLYGDNHDRLERQALHCHQLTFQHPFTDQTVTIECPLPADLQNLLEN